MDVIIDNEAGGKALYLEDPSTREWFLEQWKQWPNRVNEENTTNISFLYGGILAHRELYNETPVVSEQYDSCVKFLEDND